jgi:peroxiredoxin
LRGYVKHGFAQKVRAAGGEVYAISSEPQALADRAASDWRLDFETLGDPHHEISGACRERGWIDLFVNERLEFLRASTSDAQGWAPAHPKGYFQPGVLALESDGRVLYRWRGVPTHKNMGGATERPTAEHVWTRIARGLESAANPVDAPLDTEPELDSSGIPWPVFASLLIANGWFVTARGFKSARHVMLAGVRLLAFASAWIGAFVWLPTLPVAVALAGWVAFITPKVRWVGREFQNVRVSST